MRDNAEVVVVGAGIMGLSIAYHLAERGVRNVTVIDRNYLCGGASGRSIVIVILCVILGSERHDAEGENSQRA